MLDRRLFLAASASAAALMPRLAFAAPQSVGDPAEAAKLDAVLDRIFKEQLKESPQGMTGLGLDTGEGAWARSHLDDVSQAQVDRGIVLQKKWMADLMSVDRSKLAGMAAVSGLVNGVDSGTSFQVLAGLGGFLTACGVSFLVGVAFLLWMGLTPGEAGDNRYGSPPRAQPVFPHTASEPPSEPPAT